jgi:hypothetical protein
MKYIKDYKKIFESKDSLSVDDVVYFSYYYSYSANKDSAEIFDEFINKYQNKINDNLLIVFDNNSRKKLLSYADDLIDVISNDPEMKQDFINTLNKIKSHYNGYISLMDIDDCLYSGLIDEHPSIEYDFHITSNAKDIEVSLEIRKELCDELEEDGSLEHLKRRFENILGVKCTYKINYSKKMSNYLNNNVKYTLIK